MAFFTGISCCKAKNAKKAPPNILIMPGTIQPGPATNTAAHQRARLARVFSGRKRK